MSLRRICTLAVGLVIGAVLAACGGGGTAATTTTSTTTSGLNDYALPANSRILMKFGDGTLSGLVGDATIKGYENWISVQNVSLSFVREFVQSAHAGTADLFTGVSQLNPIDLQKNVDGSSPGLLKSAWGGGAIGGTTGTATISMLVPGDVADPSKLEVYKIELVAPIVAALSQSIDSGGLESVSLWYYKIRITWRPIDPRTGLIDTSKEVKVGWDRIQNKPWN